MARVSSLVFAMAALALIACSEARRQGSPRVVGRDAAVSSDASETPDAQVALDAESAPDAHTRIDAGAARDSGLAPDAQSGTCLGPQPEDTHAACSDGCSNDGDQYIDCDDRDCCSVVSGCPSSSYCGRNAGRDAGISCSMGPEDNPIACSDSCSNDGDPYIDCEDYDCCDVVRCPSGTACYGRTSPDAGTGTDAGTTGRTCFGAVSPLGPTSSPVDGLTYGYAYNDGYRLELVFTLASPAAQDYLQSGYNTVAFRLAPSATYYDDHLGALQYVYLSGPFPQWSSYAWDVRSVEFTTLQLASNPGTCDGRLVGRVTGSDFVGGMARPHSVDFDLPINLAESQLFNPNCAPPGTPWTQGVDCCTGWTTYNPQTGQNTCS